MLLIPLDADVTMYLWPIMNFVFIGTITIISALAFNAPADSGIDVFVLRGWSLLGNMVFLWALGKAVCAKAGNFTFAVLFFILALAAAVVHLLFDGDPAIGASGAINGVVGMFLVYFPRNDIRCFCWFLHRFGTFHVSSIWLILLWLVFDLWGATCEGDHVAHFAHLGGFAAGVTIGLGSLIFDWVEMTKTECSLLGMIKGGR